MAVKNSVNAIPAIIVSSATIGAAFSLAGKLSKPCFMISITNASTEDVFVSYDGTNTHDYCIEAQSKILPFQTNAQPNTSIANMASGTEIWLRGTAGMGNIIISGYYQEQGASK